MKIARRRLVRWIAIAVVVLVLMPVVLTPLYALVPPPSMLMLRDIVTFTPYKRAWVGLDDVSPNMIRAVVAGEDGSFCSHDGVDWTQLFRVIDAAGDSGPRRGASTITMQTVKNLYLWNSRSYVRKALEIPLALYTDLVWSKRRTLEIYLNIAELGPHLYGVEAAAQTYFGKPAKKLARREAALIAASLPNPDLRNPRKPTRNQLGYARLIERRAAGIDGYLDCLKK